MLDESLFADKLSQVMEYHNYTLENYYNHSTIDYQQTLDEALEQAKLIRPMIIDVADEIYTRMSNDENILFEGAQGALPGLPDDTGRARYMDRTCRRGVRAGLAAVR